MDTLPLFPFSLASHLVYSVSFSLFKCIFSSPCDYLVSFLLAAACYYVILVIRPPAGFTFAFVRSSCFPQPALLFSSSFPLPLPLSSLFLSRVLMVSRRMRIRINGRRETFARSLVQQLLVVASVSRSPLTVSSDSLPSLRFFSFLSPLSSAHTKYALCKLLLQFTRLLASTKVKSTKQLLHFTFTVSRLPLSLSLSSSRDTFYFLRQQQFFLLIVLSLSLNLQHGLLQMNATCRLLHGQMHPHPCLLCD